MALDISLKYLDAYGDNAFYYLQREEETNRYEYCWTHTLLGCLCLQTCDRKEKAVHVTKLNRGSHLRGTVSSDQCLGFNPQVFLRILTLLIGSKSTNIKVGYDLSWKKTVDRHA